MVNEEKPTKNKKKVTTEKLRKVIENSLLSSDDATSLGEILYYKHIEYQNSKGKTKKKKDESSSPVPYVKLIYSDKTKKILTIFRTKGNKSINPFDYLNQYFNTKMAIFESIYLAKNIISLQIKAYEVYIKPLKPRESILEIKESDDEDYEYESDKEDKQFEGDEDNVFED